MKKIIIYILSLLPALIYAQNQQLANNYFEKGEFEKALVIYEQLAQKQPTNTFIVQRMVATYQQLEQYNEAEQLLQKKLKRIKRPVLLVELGYNHQLQNDTLQARNYYTQALDAIAENPGYVYSVANTFEKKVLPKEALQAYEKAMSINENMNFDYQMALLQGQLGNMELMIDNLLNYAYKNQQNLPIVQNQLSRFMNEESPETFNNALRKTLLIKTQKTQDIFWNHFLSWFFVQQRDYRKAFMQERAIYKREPTSFNNIVALARLAIEEDETETARDILNFILENTEDPNLQMQAHTYLLKMDIAVAPKKEYTAIKKRIDDLLAQFGVSPYSLDLQLLKADFDAFYLQTPNEGIATLNNALKLQLNKYQVANVKMKLSDILLLEEKFNQAIIYYAQIEEDLKNDAVGHQASLKVAKSTYFKGDFEWAQKQLKVLKSSSSQLIANDALELFLLITDNTVEDSTQTALKKFARADFKLYQNKKTEALDAFKAIIATDKTESIQDITLLRIGNIYQTQGKYTLALEHYKQIIDNYADGVYIDEALFFSAEIYSKKLNDTEKAKALYEKVLFEHQDSIYFVEARKQFRKLRGDTAS
ncbi:tetratricopeptide repeat protein [Flavobacterium litorale]|uniref:Tetratricopeptide repeat protein n=1 Tax=Flavobacterium litorale TaxID=2856519 RepID=A0ABX8V8N8_9FLAO|nr:tetratricopeptide repeat protein [Flavobacterium litorale]QYJ69198.1 tetratricopeptide repeat protein [Flavobacterium litorale]